MVYLVRQSTCWRWTWCPWASCSRSRFLSGRHSNWNLKQSQFKVIVIVTVGVKVTVLFSVTVTVVVFITITVTVLIMVTVTVLITVTVTVLITVRVTLLITVTVTVTARDKQKHLNQGLSKQQEVCFTPLTKVKKKLSFFGTFLVQYKSRSWNISSVLFI